MDVLYHVFIGLGDPGLHIRRAYIPVLLLTLCARLVDFSFHLLNKERRELASGIHAIPGPTRQTEKGVARARVGFKWKRTSAEYIFCSGRRIP